MSAPQVRKLSDIHCVTTWSRYDNRWEGVTTHELMEAVQPKPEATHVLLTSHDGYTTNLTIEDFGSPEALLVHSWEGKPLSRDHGGPVRLVVPHRYLWKSAKWLRRIEFATADHPGFWEVRGYHNHADPWREEALFLTLEPVQRADHFQPREAVVQRRPATEAQPPIGHVEK